MVIANAAINLSPGKDFKEIDVDEQMETLKVNVRSTRERASLEAQRSQRSAGRKTAGSFSPLL